MANEIIISYPDHGATLYATLIRASDRLVWDTVSTTFVAWVDANLGRYAIPLVNSVDDTWSASMPPVLENTYVWSFYLQAGASPAVGDTVLDAYTGLWTPTTVGLSPYALATLAGLKAELKITVNTYDNYLITLINQASALFEKLCDDRKFVARDYHEFARARKGRIITYQYPILDVYNLGWSNYNVASLKYAATTEIGASYKVVPGPDDGTPVFKFSVTDENGAETVRTYACGTYKSIKTLAAAVQADWPNLTFTVVNNAPSDMLMPTKPINLLTKEQQLYVVGSDIDVQFVEAEAGMIGTGWSVLDEYIMVKYRAGYEVVPDDIQFCVTTIAKNMYLLRSNNFNMRSVSLGNYAYTMGDRDLITPQVEELLQMRCRKSIK